MPARQISERLSGLAALLAFPLLAGLAVTFIGWLLITPFVVGPALGGLVAGAAAAYGVPRLGARGRSSVLAAAIAAGLGSYLTVHVADYARFRSSMHGQFRLQFGAAQSDAATDMTVSEVLVSETGRAGIVGYTLYKLESSGGAGSGSRLRLVAWLADLCAATGAAYWNASRLTRPIPASVAATLADGERSGAGS